MRKRITTMAIVGALAVATAATAATRPSATKTETFTAIDTSNTSQTATVIATGAFTDGGTFPINKATKNTIRLGRGTIQVRSHATQPPKTVINQSACLVTEHAAGTYTLSHGTGAYKGISGSGRFKQSASQVGPRVNGRCSFTSGSPIASQQSVIAKGKVSLP